MFLSKRSNGIYHLYYKLPNGKRTSISTHSRLKSEALKFLTDFSIKQKEKEQQKFAPILLKDFTLQFLKYSESIHSYKTTLLYKTTFKYLIRFLGNMQLGDITQNLMNEYFQNRIKNSSIYRARIDRINLGFAFNKAVAGGYLLVNPCKNIKRFKIPERLPRFFSENEFEKLLQVIDNPDLKEFVIFAVQTGLRQMELITLEWNQINFDSAILILDNQNHLTKGKKIRTIPLSKTALKILKDRKSRDGLLNKKIFTYQNEIIDQHFISLKFKSYVIESGINPKLNFHSLRHTFASWLVQRGVSIYEVSKLLGHSDIKTTEIYSHLRAEDLRKSVSVLD